MDGLLGGRCRGRAGRWGRGVVVGWGNVVDAEAEWGFGGAGGCAGGGGGGLLLLLLYSRIMCMFIGRNVRCAFTAVALHRQTDE